MFGILALLGFGGVMAKQEIGRSFDTIDSREQARKKGNKTYVDGYGNTRWTDNAHLVMLSVDKDGYSCWYDLDSRCIIDRCGYRQHLEDQKRAVEEAKKEREKNMEIIAYRRTHTFAETRKKYPDAPFVLIQ